MSVIKGSLWFDRKKGFYGSFCLNSSKLFTISGIGQKDDKNDNDFHLSQRKRRNEGLSPVKIWILSCAFKSRYRGSSAYTVFWDFGKKTVLEENRVSRGVIYFSTKWTNDSTCLYSCNKITTNQIQISRQIWNVFFSNISHQLMIQIIPIASRTKSNCHKPKKVKTLA